MSIGTRQLVHIRIATSIADPPPSIAPPFPSIAPQEHGQSVGMLSGGEKSYTSAILLSAIAKVANPPFRLIDEFDVYQDEETRRKTMTMILADAKAVPDSDGLRMQYILLTPHDVSSAVPLNEDWLTVHRMKDPRREGGAGAGAGDP